MSSSANFFQTVVRYRGDTKPQKFRRVNLDGNGIDITGRSYRLVVDPSQSPQNSDNNVYSLDATITDAETGDYEFPLTQVQADSGSGQFFFDVEETITVEGSPQTETIGGGTWVIKQGIS